MNLRIKEFRKKQGLTQAELSQKINVSTRTIQKYESGEIKPPIDKINLIAKILNVAVSELIGAYDNETNKYNFGNIEYNDLKDITDIKNQELSKSFIIELENLKPLDDYLCNFENLTKDEFTRIYESYKSQLIISISLIRNTQTLLNRVEKQNILLESYRFLSSELKNLTIDNKFENK